MARNNKIIRKSLHLFVKCLEESFQSFLTQMEGEDITRIMKRDEMEMQQLSLYEIKSEIKKNINAKKSP